MIHTDECIKFRQAVGSTCPTPHKLSKNNEHWWSDWPGAYCMGCGCDDPNELCLADCKFEPGDLDYA